MRLAKVLHFAAGLSLSALSAAALADDTDIYMSLGSLLPPGSEPMVIFSLDYRPNLGSEACTGNECNGLIAEGHMPATGPYTLFDVLRGALRKVMEPVEGVRVGLFLNHASNNNCAGPGQRDCSNGGYIAMGVEPFQAGDGNGAKARFHGILDAIPTPQGNVSHSYQGKELFFEMFRYLTGQDVYNGHNGWADYGSKDTSRNLDFEAPEYAWDTSIEANSGKSYLSPLAAANHCTSIFTVNPLFQVANQEDDSDAAIQAPVADGGLGISPDSFTNVIQYLHDVDLADGSFGEVTAVEGKQNVRSYFLVEPSHINRTTIGYAAAGGTGVPLAFSDDPEELVDTLQEIFKQVLSVSTTFVAATVPVNAFNRAELLDHVYLALFQVDGDLRPSWHGNLKKLRLSSIDGTMLVDALGNAAVASDGRIRFDALTYWTLAQALPPPDESVGEEDGRDGRFVGRGGAGQRIPGVTSGSPGLVNGVGTRQLFYDRNGSLAALNADPITAIDLQDDLGAASELEATELIAFARGTDVDDLDGDMNLLDGRPWLFGDALHSQPLVLNYGARSGYSQSNPAVYVAVGSNDGYMRLIRNTTTGGMESGEEVWAFMPREAMGIQKTLRANSSGMPHPYGVDGSASAWVNDSNHNGTIESGESVYMYFGLRRGGKAYYALDVSDPENPDLLWTIEKNGDFSELGYTFSRPRIGHVDIGEGRQPVVIFGGGYDLNKDDRTTIGTDDSEGTAIYVVDAETGELIWKARGGTSSPGSRVFEHPDLVDSVPSTVTIADSDGDTLTDRILVGDTGGNVWRADLAGTDTSSWKLTRLAALGRHAETGKGNDRRFFHRPDLVPAEDESGPFDGVVLGSGDRPDPLDVGGVVSNYLYMLKDRNIAKGAGVDANTTPAALDDVTDNCLQEGSNCGLTLANGWKLQLEEAGEKSLATPITIAGTVFFTTYVPPGLLTGGSCSPAEGSGLLYAVDLQNASAVINYDAAVDGDAEGRGTTKSDRRTVLNSPGIPAEVVSLPPDQVLRPDLQPEELDVSTRWRTFWYAGEDSDL